MKLPDSPSRHFSALRHDEANPSVHDRMPLPSAPSPPEHARPQSPGERINRPSALNRAVQRNLQTHTASYSRANPEATLTDDANAAQAHDLVSDSAGASGSGTAHIMQAPGNDSTHYPPTSRSMQSSTIAENAARVAQEPGQTSADMLDDDHWEPERGPLLGNGPSLKELSLFKDNAGVGIEGSVSILTNENGQHVIAKISNDMPQVEKRRFFGHQVDQQPVDNLAHEFNGYKRVYEAASAGPHPNLVNVYGIANILIDGHRRRALLMDHVQGPTGHDVFKALRQCWRAGKISSEKYWGAVQFIARRLFDVTDHLGKAGVVHNDIKPANFIVDEATGEPVVIDLGFWCATGEKARGKTVGFMSPEAEYDGTVNEYSDVFTVAASIVHGVEGSTSESATLPNKGVTYTTNLDVDSKGNPVRKPGTYRLETAYTRFSNELITKRIDIEVEKIKNGDDTPPGDACGHPSQAAKMLDFLNQSMLDDDASRKVIIQVIELARTENQKPVGNRR